MSIIKKLLYKNIYSIFIGLVLIISSIFFCLIKFSFDKIVALNPSLYNEVNKLIVMFVVFIILLSIIICCFIYFVRKSILDFSDKMCETIDAVINKERDIDLQEYGETLLSKLQNRLKRLVEILDNDRELANIGRDNIKALIADISHQIKTPISNISMYNETLIERNLTREQQIMCLENMKFQVSKLEWLVKALIKMSRLENNIISLNTSNGSIKDTIATALSGIYLKAEDKNISVDILCSDDIKINHDKKWTSEALFNIMENAVKYNKTGGDIYISVEKWNLFTKIDITDTGIGIDEEEINNIFKRFYRGKEVSEVEGVGIGLYLANEIITKQGGYIKVNSKKNNGSTFSIFLAN